MLKDFNEIANEAKIWVFPSNKKLYEETVKLLKERLTDFFEKWPTNKEIECGFSITKKYFIMVAADVSDKHLLLEDYNSLTSFIQELEKEFSIILLDKLHVHFLQGDFVQFKELEEFKKMIKSNSVSSKTLVYNSLITYKEELNENWEIPITESWLSRFIK